MIWVDRKVFKLLKFEIYTLFQIFSRLLILNSNYYQPSLTTFNFPITNIHTCKLEDKFQRKSKTTKTQRKIHIFRLHP